METPLVEKVHELRKQVDAVIQAVKVEADKKPEKGGAELTLSFRALQMGKMWLGQVLGELGSELPAQYADKS